MNSVTLVLLGLLCSSLIATTVLAGSSQCELKSTWIHVLTREDLANVHSAQLSCLYLVTACRGVCASGIKYDIIVTGSTSKNESHRCSTTNDGLTCCKSSTITTTDSYSPAICVNTAGVMLFTGPTMTMEIPTACACGACIGNLGNYLPENTCHKLYWDI